MAHSAQERKEHLLILCQNYKTVLPDAHIVKKHNFILFLKAVLSKELGFFLIVLRYIYLYIFT